MGLAHSPRIVTDGLVLALDAGNTKSFNNTSPDEYFSNVSLLLNGNGSNGSTTITDSSTHNHSITVSGNAQISTTQSKFGGSSMLFDGDGDYVRATDSSEFAFGTGDFTVEGWLRGTGNFYETRTSISQAPGFGISVASNTIKIWDGQGQAYVYNGSTTYDWTNWHHVAISRSGTTLRVFVDGSLDGTATTSRNLTHQGAIVGANINRVINGSGGDNFNGYIDDVRITKGVARYTSNFTPPTSQHPTGPVWTDIVGGNTGTLTNGPTFSSDNGGYIDFDGSNDQISCGSSDDFAFGTGDFTIEFWCNPDALGTTVIISISSDGSFSSTNWQFRYNNSSNLRWLYSGSSDIISNSTVSTGEWTHIVATRSGTALTLYINAVSEATGTSSANLSDNGTLRIGTSRGQNHYFNGKISNVKLYKGKALTSSEVLQNFNALKGRYV